MCAYSAACFLFAQSARQSWRLAHVQVQQRLAQDHGARCAAARAAGAPEPPAIPPGELTVRVVNITDKVAEVKPQFREHFGKGGCASHFKFKQKVLLLFQAIEGVDVLLFIVFVQARSAGGASFALAPAVVNALPSLDNAPRVCILPLARMPQRRALLLIHFACRPSPCLLPADQRTSCAVV